jgi:hypothetical protein
VKRWSVKLAPLDQQAKRRQAFALRDSGAILMGHARGMRTTYIDVPPSPPRKVAADPAQSQPPDAQSRRAIELDSVVLPVGSRDRSAGLLSGGEVGTHRHLAREGTGANTLRAMASGLAYLEAWSLAMSGGALPWPAPEGLVLRFVAHHLYVPARRADNPSRGTPTRSRRRCARLNVCARRSARLGAVGDLPSQVQPRRSGFVAEPRRRAMPRRPCRAVAARRKRVRPLTRDVHERVIVTCADGRLADKREAALRLRAFASGRARSKIAGLTQIVERRNGAVDHCAFNAALHSLMMHSYSPSQGVKGGRAAFAPVRPGSPPPSAATAFNFPHPLR